MRAPGPRMSPKGRPEGEYRSAQREGGPASATATPARVPDDWPHRAFSRSVAVGGIDWHVQVAGQGPTLLLLHGTGSSAHTWADMLPELAGAATVVAPDLPGHAYTTGAQLASLTLPRIAGDLDALLAELGIAPVAVVAGHSAGAALALRWSLATSHPPRAIVGFNPSLVPPPALYTSLLSPVVTPIATSSLVTQSLASLGVRTRLVGRLLDSTRSAIPSAQRDRYARLFRDPSHLRGTMGFMAGADLPGLLDAASGLAVPATFVLGAQDPWVPERPLRAVIARRFPAATILRWEGGHLIHEEAPARAAALLREVLARAVASSA
jgi:magnesium chelatase accessory protein